jgi:hypothetical protein
MSFFAVFLGFTIGKLFDPILFVLAIVIGYKAKNRILPCLSALGYGLFSGLLFNGFSGAQFVINFFAGITASFAWFLFVFELERLWRKKEQPDVEDFE